MTMTKRYTGGCACGAIRYETSSTPVFENHCQCRDCQQRSGTGHGSYLSFARQADVTVTGEAKTWRVTADSGNEKIHAFCPTCGTPVYLTFVAMPELIAIHAASLDDPGQFKPHAVTYGIRANAWDTMDASLQTFERMPR
ncbi:GFA family protein [Aminobacter niigataensis]